MTLRELVTENRTRRRFDEQIPVPMDTLRGLVELARLCPSTANSQALKFRLVNDAETCAKVFPTLGWAAALPQWGGPKEGERPSAYIIVLCDQKLAKEKPIDDGICAQTMMLGAVEAGFGGCILANVRRKELAEAIGLDAERYHIDLVLALGKPVEKVVLTEVGADGKTAYYRDSEGTHYVPKRSLAELIV